MQLLLLRIGDTTQLISPGYLNEAGDDLIRQAEEGDLVKDCFI
jgi:hypothetical protein